MLPKNKSLLAVGIDGVVACCVTSDSPATNRTAFAPKKEEALLSNGTNSALLTIG
jgi:hypothetical protein